MLKLFEPDNENFNTGADGYVHAFKAQSVAWKCTEHTKSKILVYVTGPMKSALNAAIVKCL